MQTIDELREELDAYAGIPGTKRLLALLDRDTFVLTQEELERRFLPQPRVAHRTPQKHPR